MPPTPDLPPILTREQVRQVDRRAVVDLGIPSIVLMENAAIHAAAAAVDLLEQDGLSASEASIAIVCGGGNNAGDGYAMARQLHNQGADVHLFALKPLDELSGDAAVNATICQLMNLPIDVLADESGIEAAAWQWTRADLLVDAMLGTGFSGEVREPMATAIRKINSLTNLAVLAVDVPSGLDCQTGAVSKATIRATVTVTFVARKVGFQQAQAERHLGRVVVAGIGVPPELVVAAAT